MGSDVKAGVPQGPPEFKSRERDEDRLTRKPLPWWDRVKILALLLGVFAILVWNTLGKFAGLITLRDAINQTFRDDWWLLALAGLELMRQIHYLLSERSGRYYAFATKRVVGGFEKRTSKMDDWNRFRLGRLVKLLFFLFIVDLVLARTLSLSPSLALFEAPALLVRGL